MDQNSMELELLGEGDDEDSLGTDPGDHFGHHHPATGGGQPAHKMMKKAKMANESSNEYYGGPTGPNGTSGPSGGCRSLQYLIVEKLNELKARTLESGEILSNRLEHLQESFIQKCHERGKKDASGHFYENSGSPDNWAMSGHHLMDKTNLDLKQKLSEILQLRHSLVNEKYPRTLNEIAQLQSIILDEELTRWKREQQLSGNNGILNGGYLDQIQSFCEDLIELIWINRNQLKELERSRQFFLERAQHAAPSTSTSNSSVSPGAAAVGGMQHILDQDHQFHGGPLQHDTFFSDSVLLQQQQQQQQQFFSQSSGVGGGPSLSQQEDKSGVSLIPLGSKGMVEQEIGMMLAFLKGQPAQPNTTIYLQEKVTQLLSSLVTSTFIVEKQPPQVMKTNTRFTSTVRLLTGGRLLNIYHGNSNTNLMSPPQVQVNIISEHQANSLLLNNTDQGQVSLMHAGNTKLDGGNMNSGEIVNNRGTMEFHQGTRHLNVHFRNMQLKKIKRTEKKGTESVMDEKFCLHFQCQFTIGENKELIFKIWTLSLPVVVIVHGNQEPHAWATVTYDNAFGEPGRLPFQVPERVGWDGLAGTLNMKFKSMTGRGLSEENLGFLRGKVIFPTNSSRNSVAAISSHYHGHLVQGQLIDPASTYTPNNGNLVTWSQFCKEPLPDRNFTFWEWFYSIMKLTREHLRGPWVDGSIIGFLPKSQAEEILMSPENEIGTFLLRFSDSELGGITIAWLHADRQVFSVAPFTAKDLSTRSLADRVNDLNSLTFLLCSGHGGGQNQNGGKGHVVIPKALAFSKYYTPTQDLLSSMVPGPSGNFDSRHGPSQGSGQGIKGYVKPQLKTHIPLY